MNLRGDAAVMENWIPTFGGGLIASGIAWILSWRIASARAEEQTVGELKRADTLRSSDLQRAEELRAADAKRSDELRSDLREMKNAWNDGVQRVQELAENMAGLAAGQNSVNVFTAKAIEGITDKVERHAEILADHTSTIRLIVDKVMSK